MVPGICRCRHDTVKPGFQMEPPPGSRMALCFMVPKHRGHPRIAVTNKVGIYPLPGVWFPYGELPFSQWSGTKRHSAGWIPRRPPIRRIPRKSGARAAFFRGHGACRRSRAPAAAAAGGPDPPATAGRWRGSRPPHGPRTEDQGIERLTMRESHPCRNDAFHHD